MVLVSMRAKLEHYVSFAPVFIEVKWQMKIGLNWLTSFCHQCSTRDSLKQIELNAATLLSEKHSPFQQRISIFTLSTTMVHVRCEQGYTIWTKLLKLVFSSNRGYNKWTNSVFPTTIHTNSIPFPFLSLLNNSFDIIHILCEFLFLEVSFLGDN
jgi:hypothetical protein